MPKFYNNADLTTNQLLNAKLQQLGADITAAGNEGIIFYRSDQHLAKVSNGTAIDTLTNILEGVTGTGAITAGAISGKSQAISVAASSGSVPGTMSSADFTKLGNATASATNSTLVLRDGSGNFSATTITAALTGTATNASALNSQAASYYLARANHTGTQLAATISDFDTQVRTSTINQLAAPTADFSMNTHKITGVLDPTAAQDAATKSYVDSLAAGFDPKASVRLATTGNIAGATYTAAGGASARGQLTTMPNTIDSVTLVAGNRVLVKDQTTGTGAVNGLWVVSTLGTGANGVWDRATDFDQDAEVTAGAFVFVEEGTTNGDSGWVLATNNPIIIGGASGTVLVWTQFSSAASITAGNGLTKTGSTLDVVGTAGRISVAADSIDIDSAYVGQATITTLGTITTGVWTGTAIAVLNGGTGATTAAGARTNLGATTKFSSLLAGVGPAYTVAHGLTIANQNAVVQVIEVATGAVAYPDVTIDATNVIITFAVAQVTNTFRVNVIA